MNDNNLELNGYFISLSEDESDPTRKKAKFLICPLNEGNANNYGIKESDISEEDYKTLVGQPLVTKLIYNYKTKEYDFSGHLRKKIKKVNKEGNIVEFSDFTSTSPIGYHTDVYIEDVDINGTTKRCLVGEVTLWTRYYHAMEVIERLGTNLHTSWELSFTESYKEDGVTWMKGLMFLANCVLGSNVTPAYGDAGLLQIAEEEIDELAEAMQEDIKELYKNNKGGHNIMAEENIQISSLTMGDLYSKLGKALRKLNDEKWYYISYVFPLELRAIAHSYEDDETTYIEITFSVSESGELSITGQKTVEMTFVPKSDNEAVAEKYKIELETIKTELSEKNDQIIELGKINKSNETAIAEKDKVIEELQVYKEKIAEVEKAEAEAQAESERERLSNILIESEFFTKEEVETSEEIKEVISTLDEDKVKTFLANKVIETSAKKRRCAEDETSEDKPKTSKDVVAEATVDLGAEEIDYSKHDSLSSLLNNRRKRR